MTVVLLISCARMSAQCVILVRLYFPMVPDVTDMLRLSAQQQGHVPPFFQTAARSSSDVCPRRPADPPAFLTLKSVTGLPTVQTEVTKAWMSAVRQITVRTGGTSSVHQTSSNVSILAG